MKTSIINCAPCTVSRDGRRVVVEFRSVKGARALVKAFADAQLHVENPAESRRRYLKANGIPEGGIPSID